MAFGTGEPGPVGWGNADSWGGPDNGIDLMNHIDGTPSKQRGVSEDAYLALTIIGALTLLWLLGGIVFKNNRM